MRPINKNLPIFSQILVSTLGVLNPKCMRQYVNHLGNKCVDIVVDYQSFDTVFLQEGFKWFDYSHAYDFGIGDRSRDLPVIFKKCNLKTSYVISNGDYDKSAWDSITFVLPEYVTFDYDFVLKMLSADCGVIAIQANASMSKFRFYMKDKSEITVIYERPIANR
jgi:hypothetical protein